MRPPAYFGVGPTPSSAPDPWSGSSNETGRRGRRPADEGVRPTHSASRSYSSRFPLCARRTPRRWLLPPTASPARHCENTATRGATACWTALSRSSNPAIRAEGLWGLKDYKGAFEAFNSAIEANPKDMNLKVRYGLMMFEAPRGKTTDGAAEFKAALEIDPKNAQALLGLAKVGEERLTGRKRSAVRRRSAGLRSQAVPSPGADRPHCPRRQPTRRKPSTRRSQYGRRHLARGV